MGNSALKSHLETSQKTGVFQLTGKGLQEVRRTSVIRPLGANLFSTKIWHIICRCFNLEE